MNTQHQGPQHLAQGGTKLQPWSHNNRQIHHYTQHRISDGLIEYFTAQVLYMLLRLEYWTKKGINLYTDKSQSSKVIKDR